MAIIINELEVVLEPATGRPQPGGQMPVPEKPQFSPQDLQAVLDREQRNCLRLLAH
jgi:hypothetical protein